MVAYVHIEYSTHQFSEESKGGVESTPPGPCGTEKSVVLRGLRNLFRPRLVTSVVFQKRPIFLHTRTTWSKLPCDKSTMPDCVVHQDFLLTEVRFIISENIMIQSFLSILILYCQNLIISVLFTLFSCKIKNLEVCQKPLGNNVRGREQQPASSTLNHTHTHTHTGGCNVSLSLFKK